TSTGGCRPPPSPGGRSRRSGRRHSGTSRRQEVSRSLGQDRSRAREAREWPVDRGRSRLRSPRVGGRSRRLRTGRSTGLSAKADSKVPWLCEPTSGSNRYVRIRPELVAGQRGGRGHLSRERRAGLEGTRVSFEDFRNRTPRDIDVRAGALLQKSPRAGLLVFRPSQVAAPTNESASRVGARRLFERVRA